VSKKTGLIAFRNAERKKPLAAELGGKPPEKDVWDEAQESRFAPGDNGGAKDS